MKDVRHPSLYQVNTRVWLTELSQALGRPATLDDVPDAELDRLAGMGFDWVWFLSVWRTSLAGRQVSRTNPDWRKDFEETLPDLRETDIAGSGFAITGYSAHPDFGGDQALARLRQRLADHGLKLMLDFVPNHTGLDPPWLEEHPEYYVAGTEADLAREPQNYIQIKWTAGGLVLAHGRDPHFSGWPDTLQLDYGNPAAQAAMLEALHQSQCYVRLPFPNLAGRAVRLKDMLGPAQYDRGGADLLSGGLYLDLPPWGYHVFTLTTPANTANCGDCIDTRRDPQTNRIKAERAAKRRQPTKQEK